MIILAKLKPGDEVRIVAPSCTLPSIPWMTDELFQSAKKYFTDRGLTVSESKHLREKDAADSTSIEHRVADLHEAFADPKVMEITNFFFDVDSTVVSKESLQDAVSLALADCTDPELQAALEADLSYITNAGMNGEMTLEESIQKRLMLAPVLKKHIDAVTAEMPHCITPGMKEFIADLQKNGHNVFFLTAGLRDMMLPLAAALCVPEAHIFANEPVWDGERLVGFQPGPLLSNDGKAKVLALLKETSVISGKTIMVGDGMGDLKTYLLGIADDFFGAGFHAVRPNVKAKAPHFFGSVQDMRTFLQMS